MNKVTTQKYASYRQIASDVEKQISDLNEKCNILVVYTIYIIILKYYFYMLIVN